MNLDNDLINRLPDEYSQKILQIMESTVNNQKPLKISILGEFSVGKSSILNMLIGEEILPIGLEETTSIPTFIDFNEKKNIHIVGYDNSVLPIDEIKFKKYSLNPPEGVAYSQLELPVKWLDGLTIIDLPGLGSVNNKSHDYTYVQIQQTDIIIYILASRGISKQDIDVLRNMNSLGKKSLICVGKWDIVENTVEQEGERLPDLKEWEEQILKQTKIETKIIPVSKFGLGKNEILNFFEATKLDSEHIRKQRFLSELVPFLDYIKEDSSKKIKVNSTETEEEISKVHSLLLSKSEELIRLKKSIYEQRNKEVTETENKAFSLLIENKDLLQKEIALLTKYLDEKKHNWEDFLIECNNKANLVLAKHAKELTMLSETYGSINFDGFNVKEASISLPLPERIELQDYIDFAKLSKLREVLEEKKIEIDNNQNKLEKIESINVDTSIENELHRVSINRNSLLNTPIPRIIKETSERGSGATIGRTIGEILDLGLIYIKPDVAIAKVAGWIGKGAKVANVAKISKISKSVTSGINTIKKVKEQIGGMENNSMSNFGGVVEKLQILDKFSLGYWCEKIGSSFDEPMLPIDDPNAVLERDYQLKEFDNQIKELKTELRRIQEIEEQKQLFGFALQQSKEEQRVIEEQIMKIEITAKEKMENEKELADMKYQNILNYNKALVSKQLVKNFESAASRMQKFLMGKCKDYWSEVIDIRLNEYAKTLEEMKVQLNAGPEMKRNELAKLKDTVDVIEKIHQNINIENENR